MCLYNYEKPRDDENDKWYGAYYLLNTPEVCHVKHQPAYWK